MDLDGLGVYLETILVGEEILDSIALVTLELDHIAGFVIVDDGSVAGKLLFDDLEDFLQVELGRNALDGSQGFTTIALLNADMDVGSNSLLRDLSSVLVLSIRERIERLEVLDLRGHTKIAFGVFSKCCS